MPTKPGAKNPTRATTLRDARTLKLFPSVTTIMSVLAKPQLEKWKFRQITDACLAHHIREGDTTDPDMYFTHRLEEAFLKVQQAADAGTLIHNGAELALQGLEYDEEAPVFLPELNQTFPLKTFIKPIEEFIDRNEVQTTAHELRLVNKAVGYAGTTDVAMRCKAGFGILDYKTRKTKPQYACKPYDGQPMQIAAYHVAHYHSVPHAESHSVGCNLFVSTTEPGRVEACWYDGEQLEREWGAFQSCCVLWRHFNQYDPRQLLQEANA